ncbi:MAG: tetratricopeptide repeat protein, partial [Chloroflexota bacterium]|nr:tetratricopeptide repeat protein [Chloroflexota bacterium]
TEDPDTEGLADYAYSLYRASQYESAIQIYDEVNQKYPENANAWHLKGYAHLMLNDGEYSDAIAAVTEAIRLIKDQEAPEALNSHGDYLDSLGRIYQKIGETQESADHTQDSDAFKNARRCCVESLRYRPNNADTLTLLAQVFRSLGEEAEAQKVDGQLAALKVKQT